MCTLRGHGHLSITPINVLNKMDAMSTHGGTFRATFEPTVYIGNLEMGRMKWLKIIQRGVLGGMAIAAILASSISAWAEGTMGRFAYFLADSMLPALYAQDMGYFTAAGIEPEFITVQGGPTMVPAIASGEADIGYAAPVPSINGRFKGVPVTMFLRLAQVVTPD